MRLIDADKIRTVYAPIAPISIWNNVHYEHIAYAWEIDRLPTVDAKPVIHAHWMMTCDTLKKCSNCGYDFMPTSLQHYCPNCGARMDEEKLDDDE